MPGAPPRTARIACIAGLALAVFVAWAALDAVNSGLTFFYSVPVGLAAWWFGGRAGLAVALLCCVLYAVGGAVHPIPEFVLGFFLRAVFFLAVAAVVAWIAARVRALEHSAEELEAIRAALTPTDLMAAQALVRRLPIGQSVVDAILKLVRAGRPETSDLDVVRQRVAWGPGPRASQAFMLAARARAIIQRRLAPSIDDVVALAGPILRHRMAVNFSARAEGVTVETVIAQMCARIA